MSPCDTCPRRASCVMCGKPGLHKDCLSRSYQSPCAPPRQQQQGKTTERRGVKS